MGAAFSPTIANIYNNMSIILNKFLATQHYQPILLKRYIDDIIVIWTHSEVSLIKFLTALNFHLSLSFTFTFSQTSTDFLDLTIYKGLVSFYEHLRYENIPKRTKFVSILIFYIQSPKKATQGHHHRGVCTLRSHKHNTK